MGTKNNPGKYDCYEKAEPDEPLFVLIARDPMAADFVELWAHLNGCAPIDAFNTFVRLYQKMKVADADINREKNMEAYRCAAEMVTWRIFHES